MNPKTKKKVIIGGALLAIAGVCVYLYLEHKKKSKTSDVPTPDLGGGNTTETTSGGGNYSSGSSTSSAPTNDVLGFQKYANSKGYTPKLVEDGVWGSKTNKAWQKFGSDFVRLNPSTQPNPSATTTVQLQSKKAYATLNATPIWSSMSDLIPYRLASKGELLGEPIIINNQVAILSNGSSKYVALRTPNGTKYVSTFNVQIK